MGVQALEASRCAARAADAEVERCAAVTAGLAGGELAADGALLLVGRGAARRELRVVRARRRVQRSTPPAASSREIAATRWRQVT